jgi:hypothetical protein
MEKGKVQMSNGLPEHQPFEIRQRLPAGPKRSRQPIEKMTCYNILNRSGRWLPDRVS